MFDSVINPKGCTVFKGLGMMHSNVLFMRRIITWWRALFPTMSRCGALSLAKCLFEGFPSYIEGDPDLGKLNWLFREPDSFRPKGKDKNTDEWMFIDDMVNTFVENSWLEAQWI